VRLSTDGVNGPSLGDVGQTVVLARISDTKISLWELTNSEEF